MSTPPDRPRDAAGRPRNDRPRDGLGRPLPRGADGEPRQPEGVLRTPAGTVSSARQLLADGRPFHAHEVFEDAWKAAAAPEDRALWHGLAQLAVGLTHAARGNGAGAETLLRRGAATLGPLAGTRPHGLSVDALRRWAAESADSVRDAPASVVELPPLDGEPGPD